MPGALALLLARCGPAATPMTLGLLELERDRQFHRIAPSDRPRLVQVALDAGVEAASGLRNEAGNENPQQIAGRLGVRVETIEGESSYDTVSVFADYQIRPPRIQLYARAIARLDRHLKDYPDGDRLAATGTRPVFVAHELFHHLEGLDQKRTLARRQRVPMLTLGPFKLTTGLSSLAEIAAGTFAQSLLGLRHHPKLLDVVAVFDRDPAAAERLVDRLLWMSSE
jgi:hypothetical protein